MKRYKPNAGKTEYKDRSILFAAHRDACILAKYAADINDRLDVYYKANGLQQNVIAYRRLGRTNYHFSADAYRFARERNDCVILCFDITGFFDNLDHSILKNRLKRLLGVSELAKDWFAVFRYVTKFRRVERSALEANESFRAKLKTRAREPVATIAEIKAASIPIFSNPNRFGIPQGTPISAAFSNLYMIDVDRTMVDACSAVGGLYQRYSDDILVVCPTKDEAGITSALSTTIAAHNLQIKDEKTERAEFKSGSEDVFQYLGFNVSQKGATIRPSSLARLHRKAKRAVNTTRARGIAAIGKGKATNISTKRLRQRFWPTGARNFSKYARRAAKEFGSKTIVRQALRLERMVDRAVREMEKINRAHDEDA